MTTVRPISIGMVLAVLALWGALLLQAGQARASAADGRVLTYDILRDGAPVGTQIFAIRRDDETVTVDLRTEIDFKLLSLTLYRFRQEGREVWRDGRLVVLESETDDNGTLVSLEVRRRDDALVIRHGDTVRRETGELAPASLWNAAALESSRLIDTIDGSVLDVRVAAQRQEAIAVFGAAVPATYYKITGKFNREVWYDADGHLLRVGFTARDGSRVEYRLRDPVTMAQ